MNRSTNSKKRIAMLVPLALFAIALAPPVAMAQDLCDVPLFIKKGVVDANIMILFDNSGSMNEAMYHPAFDPDTGYAGMFQQTQMYYVGTTGNYHINNRDAILVEGRNGESGRYIGNYLNWIYYVATADERAAIPQETRLDVAVAVVNDFIARTDDARLGLAIFNTSDGGRVIAPCGTSQATLINTVRNIHGNTWTPLGEAMEDVLNYFKDRNDGPIQYECQKSFVIVMTDGFPTQDRDISAYLVDADGDGNDPGSCTSIGAPYGNGANCSDHIDDVAYYMSHNDLRTDLGEPGESWEDGQTVVTYAIGFGLDAGILRDTAINGDGFYVTATDAAELAASFDMVKLNIRGRVATGAAVAVVSSETGDDNYLYRGKFNPMGWSGYLESFALPYNDGDTPVWEAGEILSARSASDRTIAAVLDGSVVPLTADQAPTLHSAMGLGDVDDAADVINWARGDHVDGYRVRQLDMKLGDIIHSAPVIVGEPRFFTDDPSAQQFIEDGEGRERVVYVGANDGMLHAFRSRDGYELWAVVPEFALEMLPEIADTNYCHQYSVDLTPTVADAKVDGDWKTVLVAGAGRGGANYFAVDVTNPYDPQFMWEQELTDGYRFSSEVKFATIDDRAVLLIGSGLDTVDGRAYVYVVDAGDGEIISRLLLSESSGSRNKASTVSTVDLDFDGNSDLAYVSDLLGTVYRIDLRNTTSASSWSVSELYSGNREIQAPPMAAYGEGGDIYVYFGTGAYLEEDDISTLDSQSFYCIFDDHDESENPTLVNQTGSIDDVGTADGWYIDLDQATGERVTEPAAIVAGTVFFTTFAPNAEACSAGGRSWLYQVQYQDGSAPEESEDEDDGQLRYEGDGIASRPVIDITNESVIIQNSNQTITIEAIGSAFMHLNVRSWQENFEMPESAEESLSEEIQ